MTFLPRPFLILLLGIVMGLPASAQSGRADAAHAVSLRVMVDEHVVMSPNLRLKPGIPASIEISPRPTEPGYLLQVRLTPDLEGQGSQSSLEATLWKGDRRGEHPLLDTILLLDPQHAGKMPASASRDAEDGRRIEIQVVSHARTMSRAEGSSARPGVAAQHCQDTAQMGSPATRGAPPVCCSISCGDGGGSTMKCCGADECGACGVCCSNAS